jgi:hypothetical protein
VSTVSPGFDQSVDRALDHVELQRVDVLLVLLVARLAERQHAADADVVPEGGGVLRQIQCEKRFSI